jgi:hypothetical protein
MNDVPATSGPPTKALAALHAGNISLANSSCIIESSLSFRLLVTRWLRLWIALCARPCLQASVFVSKSTWRCSLLMALTASTGWKEMPVNRASCKRSEAKETHHQRSRPVPYFEPGMVCVHLCQHFSFAFSFTFTCVCLCVVSAVQLL